MKNNKTTIIYFRESAIQSIIADLFSFGLFLGSLAFNHYILLGKWYIDLFFLWMGFTLTVARSNKHIKRFNSMLELIDYLNKEENDKNT
jgi:hypothetical protein